MMDKSIVIMGLQKSAIVLHSLAFKFTDKNTRDETLTLVSCIAEAVKLLEQQEAQ
jgi:hypothetical protein